MLSEWVLVVRLLTPGGDLVDQQTLTLDTRAACIKERRQWRREERSAPNPMHLKYHIVCMPRQEFENSQPTVNSIEE